MLKFFLIFNKQGQPRLQKYYDSDVYSKNIGIDLVRKCLLRSTDQTMFFYYGSTRVVFSIYGSLVFITGIDNSENELAASQFIHLFVLTLDKYFAKWTELDLLFNIDKVHMILDEMMQGGHVTGCSRAAILAPIHALDKVPNT